MLKDTFISRNKTREKNVHVHTLKEKLEHIMKSDYFLTQGNLRKSRLS